jgi:hypothetical protein
MWLLLLVSRVLSRALVTLGALAVIPLGRSLPNASCSLPRGSGRQPSNAPLCGLAPDGVCHATTVTGCAVGSYSTFSPLPKAPGRFGRSDSLWHFPRGFPHRALPGILPCGARTFLSLVLKRDCDRLRCSNDASLASPTWFLHEQIARSEDPAARRAPQQSMRTGQRDGSSGVVDVEPAVAARKFGDPRLQLLLGSSFELARAFARHT